MILPQVNVSLLYAQIGQDQKAADALAKALKIDPANAAANFNMGLLQAELKNLLKAEQHLRAALKADPAMAEAAFNLGVLLAARSPAESLPLLRKARELRPKDSRYAYTLAFYVNSNGGSDEAAEILRGLIAADKGNGNAYALLADIYERTNQLDRARALYREAIANDKLPLNLRRHFGGKLRAMNAER
jgi:Tfp pilus assembly protein PilF